MPSAGYVNPAAARAVWTGGARGPLPDSGEYQGPRAPIGLAGGRTRVAGRSPKKARLNPHEGPS
jgi:hypothetical protein